MKNRTTNSELAECEALTPGLLLLRNEGRAIRAAPFRLRTIVEGRASSV